tara:strand:+ start:483 stop:743 length:261 start_codon:yes stop_codon:yes gene_type:complete
MGLEVVELILAYEEEFDIEINESYASNMISPLQVIETIEKILITDKRPFERFQIEATVKEITITQLKLKESDYIEDAGFRDHYGVG